MKKTMIPVRLKNVNDRKIEAIHCYLLPKSYVGENHRFRQDSYDDSYLTLTTLSKYTDEQYKYYVDLLIQYGVDFHKIDKGHEPKIHHGDANRDGWSIQFSLKNNMDEVIKILWGFINDSQYVSDEKSELLNLLKSLIKSIQESSDTSPAHKRILGLIEPIHQQICADEAQRREQEFTNKNQPLHDIFSDAIARYNRSRQNRFTFFGLAQRFASQRNTAIDELSAAYESYKSNYGSKNSDESKSDFFRAVIDIRDRVQAAHLKGSRFATLGLTKSGLVKEIDNALAQCVKQGFLAQEDLSKLQPKALDNTSPARIATFK